MYKAFNGHVTVPVMIFINDTDEHIPVMISLMGQRNSVHSLISSCFLNRNMGDSDGVGFHIDRGEDETTIPFKLPTKKYTRVVSKVGKSRIIEGRILSELAQKGATKDTFYVLTPGEITMPVGEAAASDAWMCYMEWTASPLDKKWTGYVAPEWCVGLHRLYVSIKAKLPIPLHYSWMPYLFRQMTDYRFWESRVGKYLVPIRYVEGYVAPIYQEHLRPESYLLRAAYAVNVTSDTQRIWMSQITNNPDRAQYIKF